MTTDIQAALLSLEGLSVGDGFGQRFFNPAVQKLLVRRQLPPALWRWTDDTHMALSIVEVLVQYGQIKQEPLAQAFARRFAVEPWRGYAGGAYRLLSRVSAGESWRDIAPFLFPGGSYGNGGAMRAAPIGGFFKDNPARAALEGQKSAQVTHYHPEGQAGAMAIAAAAAIAATASYPTGTDFLREVLPFVPASQTRDGIERAINISPDQFSEAVTNLGTGYEVSAQDTVPFCLWCAAYHLNDFEQAMWQTVAGAGDQDTTCAIVGGIVALSAGEVPQDWIARRETLPEEIGDW